MTSASIDRHPELVSGSHEIFVTLEMLKQVQHDAVGKPVNTHQRKAQ